MDELPGIVLNDSYIIWVIREVNLYIQVLSSFLLVLIVLLGAFYLASIPSVPTSNMPDRLFCVFVFMLFAFVLWGPKHFPVQFSCLRMSTVLLDVFLLSSCPHACTFLWCIPTRICNVWSYLHPVWSVICHACICVAYPSLLQ